MTIALEPRWYVRGTNDAHSYDRKVPTTQKGLSFCQSCLVVHADPIGKDWHIESPDVDTMLCGMRIDFEGEVRTKPGKNICPRCQAALDGGSS